MAKPEAAVLLADISGSTALFENVGNAEAMVQVSTCLDMLRHIVEAHDGRFISSKGDDILCIFDISQHALDTAIKMLEAVKKGPLSLHAGIDFGPIIRTHDDVFGDSVNTAARLAALAKSGEILCSQILFDQLEEKGKSSLRYFDARQFKGKAEPTKVYLFSGTMPGQETQFSFVHSKEKTGHPPDEESANRTSAELRFRGQKFVCTRQKDVSIGRSADCDVIVSKPWVSRSHATLEIRQEHAYLRDTSSSGTYICFVGQPPILVRRESVLLSSSCELSLAKHPENYDAELIRCEVVMTPHPII